MASYACADVTKIPYFNKDMRSCKSDPTQETPLQPYFGVQ